MKYSGQISVNERGDYVKGTITEEARLAFNNVFATIDAAGFDKSEIAYINIAFSDLSLLNEVNELYTSLFPKGKKPARTVYEAAKLSFNGVADYCCYVF